MEFNTYNPFANLPRIGFPIQKARDDMTKMVSGMLAAGASLEDVIQEKAKIEEALSRAVTAVMNRGAVNKNDFTLVMKGFNSLLQIG